MNYFYIFYFLTLFKLMRLRRW